MNILCSLWRGFEWSRTRTRPLHDELDEGASEANIHSRRRDFRWPRSSPARLEPSWLGANSTSKWCLSPVFVGNPPGSSLALAAPCGLSATPFDTSRWCRESSPQCCGALTTDPTRRSPSWTFSARMLGCARLRQFAPLASGSASV